MRFMNWLCQFFGFRTRRNAQDEEYERLLVESCARQEARKENHQRIISHARRLLTGNCWRDPDGKETFVKEVYEGKMPSYLWYAIGDNELSEVDSKVIVETFWGESGPGFGDYELHGSRFSDVGVGLRIRNPMRMEVEIVIAGQKCPLYQTGHSDPFGYVDEEPVVLFPKLYEEQESAGCHG